jgi:long-subunit fatty acid transport protein
LSLVVGSFCYSGEPGTVGAIFLKIPVGARPVGMGEAYGAVADDANAIYYNPAGIANINGFEATFMHDARWLGMRYEYTAFVVPVPKGVIGLGISYFSSGELEGMDVSGNPTGDFSAYDFSLAVSYALEMSDAFSLGTNLKYVVEKIEEESGSSFCLDFGGLYLTPIEGVSLGMSLQNLGKAMKLVERSYPLPMNLRLAGLYKHLTLPLTFCLDLNVPNDKKPNLCLGLEYELKKIFAIRLGYKTGSDLGIMGGFRTGFGLKWERFSLDYGYSPCGDLGSSHKFSFSFTL